MRHSICVVTGSRADYGLLRPLLLRLAADDEIEFRLVVTGSHLIGGFGNTQDEIKNDGFDVSFRIPINLKNDSDTAIAEATGQALSAFADYFSNSRPELLVILGDRYEIFAAASAALILNIDIAHISGGDVTEGVLDDTFRHCITKMSTLHFAGCEQSAKRIIQLGESPDRVFNVGELGVENCLNLPKMSIDDLQKSLGFRLDDKPYGMVTFHPLNIAIGDIQYQIYELISALEAFPDMGFIITGANADAGGSTINKIWNESTEKHPNWLVTSSLGVERYISAMKYAKLVIGNSSSGIIEAPALKIPTVNIGDRQKGRMMADSVICCEPIAKDIISSMKRALSPEFKAITAEVTNPFGDGHTSEKIFNVIKRHLFGAVFGTKKKFYDVSVVI